MTEQTAGDVQQALLAQAQKQTKALESLRFRADLVLVLILIAVLLSLGGVFR